MRTVLVVAAALAGSLSLAGAAEARGCIKGAIVGGVAGHYAGHHGLLGAAAGCAVGRHEANRSARAAREQQQPGTGQPAPR